MNVKFLTCACTTAANTEPRTYQFLLCVTYTLDIPGSESGQFTEAIPISRRNWRPPWWTESGTRRRCRRNDSARYSRGVRLGSSIWGRSGKSWTIADPSTGICMMITLRNLFLICLYCSNNIWTFWNSCTKMNIAIKFPTWRRSYVPQKTHTLYTIMYID